MNVAKAVEKAIAAVLRNYAELGADVVVRTYRALDFDGSWDATKDRQFPLVDVRCAYPVVTEGQCTTYAECAIRYATKTDDDPKHAVFCELEDAVVAAIERMFNQFRTKTDGDEMTQFKADLAADLGGNFEYSGLTWGEGGEPSSGDGINMGTVKIRVNYVRKDFI